MCAQSAATFSSHEAGKPMQAAQENPGHQQPLLTQPKDHKEATQADEALETTVV